MPVNGWDINDIYREPKRGFLMKSKSFIRVRNPVSAAVQAALIVTALRTSAGSSFW